MQIMIFAGEMAHWVSKVFKVQASSVQLTLDDYIFTVQCKSD